MGLLQLITKSQKCAYQNSVDYYGMHTPHQYALLTYIYSNPGGTLPLANFKSNNSPQNAILVARSSLHAIHSIVE